MFNNLCNNFFKPRRYRVRKIRTTLGLALTLSVFSGTVTTFADDLHQVTVIINEKRYVYNTASMTVEEFFEENEIELNEKDILDVELNENIVDNTTIIIDKAETINFILDDKIEIPFITNQTKLGLAISEFAKEEGKSVYLGEGQSSASKVVDDMEVKIYSYIDEVYTLTEEVPFEIEIIENPNLAQGIENIKIVGKNGVRELEVKDSYKGNKMVSSEILNEIMIEEPINQIVEVGTKQVDTIQTEMGTFSYTHKISMKSTAYTAGAESTGKNPGDAGYGITASGMKAQKGVVAVDTSIIPFGTQLYIEGYGYAIAGDTGSAIKGNKIDVFFDKYYDAIQYGVQTVDVYILDTKIA